MISRFSKEIQLLQTQFDTVGPYFLSNFFKPGGEKSLYDFLQANYQSKYQNNFRILIVQDCEDLYDYHDLPGRAIITLQKYASQIDISNFFLLIVTNNPNIAQELSLAQKLYSTDECSMQNHVVEDFDYKISVASSRDTFCVLPWMHLYVGPDGNVLPCCQGDNQFPLGNITEQDIDDIITSTSSNQLRKDLLEGKRRKECQRCYQHEAAGLTSGRIQSNIRWASITKENLPLDGTLIDWQPTYLDIRLNNICNLKCRMCSGYFSSSIAQEEAEIFGVNAHVESSLRAQQRKHNLGKIIRYLPTAEKIYFAGGEPLLTSEHYDILDALIACGNTKLEIIYNTNFTTLSFKNRSVLDLWGEFTNVTVGASLDGQGSVAEYVRHGTKWNTIESNFDLLKKQCPHVNFTVTSTVGFLNASSLMSLQRDWYQAGKLDISKFSMTAMISPDHLSLPSLPETHKHRLGIEIKKHIDWCQQSGGTHLANQWAKMLSYMWSKDNSHSMIEFKRLTKIMDNHRNQSLATVMPEYHNLL